MQNGDQLLKTAMKSKGLNQQQLAEGAGISRSCVSHLVTRRYEKNNKPTVRKVCDFFGMQPHELGLDGPTTTRSKACKVEQGKPKHDAKVKPCPPEFFREFGGKQMELPLQLPETVPGGVVLRGDQENWRAQYFDMETAEFLDAGRSRQLCEALEIAKGFLLKGVGVRVINRRNPGVVISFGAVQ